MKVKGSIEILIADDDAEDRVLITDAFFSKQVSFPTVSEIMKTQDRYWFEIVELPTPG